MEQLTAQRSHLLQCNLDTVKALEPVREAQLPASNATKLADAVVARVPSRYRSVAHLPVLRDTPSVPMMRNERKHIFYAILAPNARQRSGGRRGPARALPLS